MSSGATNQSLVMLHACTAMQGKWYLVNAEVLADVDHPCTQAGSCTRLAANAVGIEVGITEKVLLTLLHALQGDIVLIKSQQ